MKTEQTKAAGWIKTSERAPTEKDANQYGNVFTLSGLTGWKFVIARKLEYWMPIPPYRNEPKTPGKWNND